MRRSLSYYALFYVVSLIFMRGSGILAKIFMARVITPYEYGIITMIVISLPGILQLVTNFCFFDILGHATEGKKYFSFTLIYGIFSVSCISLVLYLFQVPLFNFLNLPADSANFLLMVLILVLFSVTISGSLIGILRGMKKHSAAASLSLAPSVLRLLIIFIAIYIFSISDVNMILIIFAIPAFLVLCAILLIKWDEIISSLNSINLPSKEILMFGFAIFIVNSWGTLGQHINRIVISHNLGIEWQGYFDVSLTLAALLTFFSSALYNISIPESTGATDKKDIFSKKGGLGDIGRLFLSMSFLFVLVIYFYSEQIIEILFSADYAPSGDYLIIIVIGYVFLYVQQFIAFTNISLSERTSNKFVTIILLSLIVYPFFTHYMMEYFGFMGAYASSTIIIIAYTFTTYIYAKEKFPMILLLQGFEKLVLSIIITFFIIYLFKPPFVFGSIFLSTIYVASLFILRYLDKDIFAEIMGKKDIDT